MASQMTELMKIVLYLLLTLGGGVLVAVLCILLIILIGALGAWLAIYTDSSKKRTNPIVINRKALPMNKEAINPCISHPSTGSTGYSGTSSNLSAL
jgi:hypothetical protein